MVASVLVISNQVCPVMVDPPPNNGIPAGAIYTFSVAEISFSEAFNIRYILI